MRSRKERTSSGLAAPRPKCRNGGKTTGSSISPRASEKPLGVVEDEHAVLARLRLGHEAEVVHVEASRARLIGDGESKMVHRRLAS